MENDYGQLIVHLINENKLPNFKTTVSYWCKESEVIYILVDLEFQGYIINHRKVYFKNKHFKY